MNLSKTTKYILILFFFHGLVPNTLLAQTTNIPDTNFEQALIDLGIDSDGIVNGQVLTSDIDMVITLDLSLKGISDITGIHDFAALEMLDVSSNDLTTLDISNNTQLKELYVSNTGTDNLLISALDVSNNINLEVLYGENLFLLESLNLKNGNNAILTVTLPCEEEGIPCELPLNCVMVDDETAATNNDPPYAGWFIQADFVYSEDCTLTVSEYDSPDVSVYPNPVKNTLIIENSRASEIERISIIDSSGRRIWEENNKFNSMDVSGLADGILIVRIQTSNGIVTRKILKE
ncbi:T9SS type A sorting domain-containing protein [Altibacter sp.]|uniref:T9SS type A sorting domain-containing protein n=1 Tax=Altibacter sp. TaxID=2024823 RepID=UPI000C89B6F7|nr:T9SS type A sorting domain-containing protein [Altibacter sp.]MAP54498.1 hypothetical protein [Altibacter sp.]